MSSRKQARRIARQRGAADFRQVLHGPGVVGVAVSQSGRGDLLRWLADRPGPPVDVEILGADCMGRAAMVWEVRDGRHHVHGLAWDAPGRITAAFLLQSFSAFLGEGTGSSGSPEPEPS
jgi:hypothetical protein